MLIKKTEYNQLEFFKVGSSCSPYGRQCIISPNLKVGFPLKKMFFTFKYPCLGWLLIIMLVKCIFE